MSIDVHTDRTDLLVYKIHEAHTSILTCIPLVFFNLDAVQKSSIFQGCKMHEAAFQSRELSGRRRKQHPGKLGTAGGVFWQIPIQTPTLLSTAFLRTGRFSKWTLHIYMCNL